MRDEEPQILVGNSADVFHKWALWGTMSPPTLSLPSFHAVVPSRPSRFCLTISASSDSLFPFLHCYFIFVSLLLSACSSLLHPSLFSVPVPLNALSLSLLLTAFPSLFFLISYTLTLHTLC